MIIAATSLAVTLWRRRGLIAAARCGALGTIARQTLSTCCRIDNVRSRWTLRCLTDVLKGTLFPPMFAHSLSTKPRRDAEQQAKANREVVAIELSLGS